MTGLEKLAPWSKMTEDEYHADPAPTASLSASMASTMINKSPRHGWTNHPRLNPSYERQEKGHLDFGSAAHAILIGKGALIEIIDAPDWRTKVAQSAREAAYAAGKTPLLLHEFATAMQMVNAAREQLAMIDDCGKAFKEGVGEAVMLWQELDANKENPIWCRSMMDWIEPRREDGHIVIYDYKTSGVDINPQTVGKHLYDMQYEIPWAMYERGLENVIGDCAGKVVFRFVVQEKKPPFLLQVVELDLAGRVIGRKKVSYAIQLWRRCLMENNWPGWPIKIIEADMPSYLESRWLEREAHEEELWASGEDPYMTASPWSPKEVVKEIIKLGEGG